MGTGAQRLVLRFALCLALIGAPVLALLGAIVWHSHASAVEHAVTERREALEARRSALEEIVASVHLHVEVMQRFVAQRLAADPEAAPTPIPTSWPGATATTPAGAVAIAAPGSMDAAATAELAAVADVAEIAAAAHGAMRQLVWSYYFSATRRFVLIYPAWDPTQFLPGPDPEAVFAGYYDYDVYALSDPARNPAGDPYWTPVYLDAGGAGLMVSHAAPVTVDGALRGVVGADVLLGFLSDFLASFPATGGEVVVVDQAGSVIAEPTGRAAATGALTPAAMLLGAPVADTGGAFVEAAGGRIAAMAVAGAPWLIAMTITDAEIAAAARERLLGIVLLAGGILAALSAFALVLLYQFVRPAADLAAFATTPNMAPPLVPQPWIPLRERLANAAAERDIASRRIRAVIDSAPIRAAVVDADHRFRYVNRAFADFFGIPAEHVVGRRIAECVGEEEERVFRDSAERIAAGRPVAFEDWFTYRGVGRRYVKVTMLPHEVDGRTGFLTFGLDLTDLKAREAEEEERLRALAESEAKTRAVVVSALDGIIVADAQGIVVDFNPAAEAMFGWSREEAVGRSIGELVVPAHMREAHEAGMARYTAGGAPRVIGRRIEIEAVRRDGTVFPVELTISEVHGRKGRLFTSHIRDLTDARRLAREMEEGRQKLQQMEKLSAMGSLLAGVAHEINNPLAIVVAQSTLLASTARDDATRARGERIQAAAERCGRIVKSFLAMARQKPPERAPLDVNEVIRHSIEMLGYGLRSNGVEVEVALREAPVTVVADRDLLTQVICNIVLNAQQALVERPAPRRLRIAAREAGEAAVVTVEDNGPGVPDEIAGRIFEPYFTTKAAGVGTGIGLSISRDIVLAHGGLIGLGDSALGGAAFTITLPLEGGRPETLPAPEEAAEEEGLRALVVDDEPDVAESLVEMLAIFGYAAERVESSEAALARIEADAPDIVFTDLRMPGLDGAELLEAIVARVPALAGRVVVVTGDSVAGPGRLAAVEGAILLEKPFTLDDVRATLLRLGGENG